MTTATTVKVTKELHRELLRRSRTLGMTMGDYVERLLLLAMEKTTNDPVEEFKTLLAYAPTFKNKTSQTSVAEYENAKK